MKYFLENADGLSEITLDRAKELLATCYIERVCTFDEMLACEGVIPLMGSQIVVKES